MQHVTEIHVLPYHALGTSKSRRLGKAPVLSETPMPGAAQTQQWISAIQEFTLALALAEVGADLLLADINGPGVEDTAECIRRMGR